MFISSVVLLNKKEQYFFSAYGGMGVIEERINGDDWRTRFAPLIFPRSSEPIQIDDAPIVRCHDGKPSLKVATKNFMLCAGMVIHWPQSRFWSRHSITSHFLSLAD